jgi:hypothetical protein
MQSLFGCGDVGTIIASSRVFDLIVGKFQIGLENA